MKRLRRFLSLFVLAAVAASSLDGCLSVGVQKIGKPDPGVSTGSLRVTVTQHRPRNGVADPPEHPLVSELSRIDGRKEIPIREVSESRWAADGLEPGKYRIRVARYVDERGEILPLPSAVEQTFRIRPGERVEAEIVVKRFPTETVVGLSAVAGGIFIAMLVSAARSIAYIGTLSKKHRKELDTRPPPAPRAAPIPSALPR